MTSKDPIRACEHLETVTVTDLSGRTVTGFVPSDGKGNGFRFPDSAIVTPEEIRSRLFHDEHDARPSSYQTRSANSRLLEVVRGMCRRLAFLLGRIDRRLAGDRPLSFFHRLRTRERRVDFRSLYSGVGSFSFREISAFCPPLLLWPASLILVAIVGNRFRTGGARP